MRREQKFNKLFFSEGRNLSFENRDKADWREVDIPHDFNVDAPFVNEGPWPEQQGFIKSRSDGTYRASFTIDDERLVFYLLADGIYRDCEIYLNGRHAGGSPYGYIPMTIDISSFVKRGENLLEIYVNNLNERDDRWYSGAGIYRRLSLLTVQKTHFVPDGVTIKTPLVSKDRAEFSISAEVENVFEETRVQVEIFNSKGIIASTFAKQNGELFSCTLSLEFPELWSPDSPNLYKARLSIFNDDREVDSIKETFGLRDIFFDAQKGFFINGNRHYLCGANLHHDSGCLGAAFYPEVWRERLLTLKSFGLNAVRVSHNPQARIFYELCDELGILVIDELYDKWYDGSYDAHFWDWYERDVRAWVRRSKNHPSVILYSVGNEVYAQGMPELFEPLDKLISAVREQDDTRPVSFGMHPYGWPEDVAAKTPEEKAEWTGKIAEHVDVLLCNYQEHWYENYHKYAPNTCIVGSELYHWYTGTDEYEKYVEKHPWEYVREHSYVLGGFYWAGIDYRGESIGPNSRGWTSSVLDITGRPKPQAYLSKAYWTDEPMVAAALSVDKSQVPENHERHGWSFPLCVSHLNMLPDNGIATILVFTNCEEVSFCQENEKLSAKKVKTIGRCHFYELELRAGQALYVYGENEGREVAEYRLPVFGEVSGLEITSSKSSLNHADSEDVSIVRLRLVDSRGETCVQNGDEFSVTLSNLKLLGLDNGDMGARHSYLSKNLSFYNGEAVLYVRGEKSGMGQISIKCGAISKSRPILIV